MRFNQRKNLYTLARRLDEIYFMCEIIEVVYVHNVTEWLEHHFGYGLDFRRVNYSRNTPKRRPNWIMDERADIYLGDPDHIYLFKVQGF